MIKYQIVIYDSRDYIIEHKNYSDRADNIASLVDTVREYCHSLIGHRIEITKWDSKTGEKMK